MEDGPTMARLFVRFSVKVDAIRLKTCITSEKGNGLFLLRERNLLATDLLAIRIRGWMNGVKKKPMELIQLRKPHVFLCICYGG